MTKCTIRKLRSATKEVLSAVTRGHTVLITSHGKPCAKLMPISKQKKREPSDLFGIWKDNEKARPVKDYLDKLRKNRHAR
jgi:prevent-host-death family protein